LFQVQAFRNIFPQDDVEKTNVVEIVAANEPHWSASTSTLLAKKKSKVRVFVG